MKVLVTGRGSGGSWEIRGRQLGAALGAKVKPMATLEDCRNAHLIVAVKRVPGNLLEVIRRSGRPWAWDMVDAYPQPDCGTWAEAESIRWLRGRASKLAPSCVIWPTGRAQADGGGGGLVLHHHHRPGVAINPVRQRIEVVAYEGDARYLEGWEQTIQAQCQRIGARFIVNPPQLADADVVLALRGPAWNGYPQRRWKSNVKLANAHASGTPFIGMPEDGYQETATGGEYWVKAPNELGCALDWLDTHAARAAVSRRFLAAAFSVDAAAVRLKEYLCTLK